MDKLEVLTPYGKESEEKSEALLHEAENLLLIQLNNVKEIISIKKQKLLKEIFKTP